MTESTTLSPVQAAQSDEHVAALRDAIESIVRTTPGGLSEMALLKALQQPPWELLGPIDFRTPAALYPVHFLLFHLLYQWRESLSAEGEETLEINALGIFLRPLGQARGSAAGHNDPLRDFYLDPDNLRLPEDTIEGMVNDFWQGVRRPPEGELEAACDTLNLDCPPASLARAKSCFRKLAMRHHPDRGGSNHRLQELNAAMAVVRQHFR